MNSKYKTTLAALASAAIGAAAVAVVFVNAALAEGTAADAKAMLDKTIAALKADKANAKVNLGKDIRLNKDATGDVFGERLYAAAKAGSGEVTYMFPKAGADK